ncbi:MAG TPA: hypothetical protein VIY86_02520, partial [Pirellulaceae bacterium]
HGPRGSFLGRLIVPVSQLTALAQCWEALPPGHREIPWRVSALLPAIDTESTSAWEAALGALKAFDRRSGNSPSRLFVDTWELPCSSPDGIEWMAARIPDRARCFVEVPLDQSTPELLLALKGAQRLNAKVRTGGVTAVQIPSPEALLDFLQRTARLDLAFKATAGLHHPLPAIRPLTYEPNAPQGPMHGFLNVMLATAFARRHPNQDAELLTLLSDPDPSSFGLAESCLTWRGRTFDDQELRSLRRTAFLSLGSCSFDEPLADLCALGWLET